VKGSEESIVEGTAGAIWICVDVSEARGAELECMAYRHDKIVAIREAPPESPIAIRPVQVNPSENT
jgi:hypothetical protein